MTASHRPSFLKESHAEEAALSHSCSTSSSSSFFPCSGSASSSLPPPCPAPCPYVFSVSSPCACLGHQLLRPTLSSSCLLPRPSPSSYQLPPFPPPCLGPLHPRLSSCSSDYLPSSSPSSFHSPPLPTCSPLLPHSSLSPRPSSSPCLFPYLHGPWAQIDHVNIQLPECGLRILFWLGCISSITSLHAGMGHMQSGLSCLDTKVTAALRDCGNANTVPSKGLYLLFLSALICVAYIFR